MRVTARLLPPVGGAFERGTVDFSLTSGATVRNLLDAVVAAYPETERYLLDPQGRLLPVWRVFRNDQPLVREQELLREVELADGDEIILLMALAGG